MIGVMAKIKIEKQEHYFFKTKLNIRVSDLNYGGHLGYDKVLTLLHQARLELFEMWGVTELDLGDQKTGIVAADAGVNYLGEGFLNDEILIEIQPVDIGAISFRLAHRITGIKKDTVIALAEIGFVGFDYSRRAPSRLPAPFMKKLKDLAAGKDL
jgi:acyl-CoA thioesterase FadM